MCPYRAAHCALVVRLVHVTPAADAHINRPIAPNRNHAHAAARRRGPGYNYRRSPPCHGSGRAAPRRSHAFATHTRAANTRTHACAKTQSDGDARAHPHARSQRQTCKDTRVHTRCVRTPMHTLKPIHQHRRCNTLTFTCSRTRAHAVAPARAHPRVGEACMRYAMNRYHAWYPAQQCSAEYPLSASQ